MTPTAQHDPLPTVAGARRELAGSLRRHGLASPELDSRLLVGHALGLDHAELAAQAERVLNPAEAQTVAALTARRLAREPVARIIGVKEFWGLEFKLNAATLVPRPETETVVEAALDVLERRRARENALCLADLGTGSGALLLALLAELPAARGLGTDRSCEALVCARDNAVALGLASRAAFVACDFGAALKGAFDLVVSNPPYVAHNDIATLAPEVRVFDPSLALDGGADGLDAYRAITTAARNLLSPQGVMVLELGAGQLAAVESLLPVAGLAPVGAARHDLLGIARALVVRLLP
jgi:release factor glutamine methyltransferase